MRLLETYFYRISLLICLSSACYMTYLQFKYYLNNDDLASISKWNQRFNKEENDEYPTFTICLFGFRGEIIKKSHEIFNLANVTRYSYFEYLRGSLKQYPDQFSDIKFDEVAFDIHEAFWISSYENIVTKQGSQFINPFSMLPSHQDTRHICISKKSSYREGVRQVFDVVQLNSTTLYEANLMVRVFVHQNGKLMRNLRRPDFVLRPDRKSKDGTTTKVNIGQVDILQKRETSKIPCDKNLKEEDKYILQQVISNVGCVPTFWQKFADTISINRTTRICETTADYFGVRRQLAFAFHGFDTDEVIYKKPCTVMMAPTTTEEVMAKKKGRIRFIFWYHLISYREIKNIRAYTSETLLGQVGGFVGILYESIRFQRFKIIRRLQG